MRRQNEKGKTDTWHNTKNKTATIHVRQLLTITSAKKRRHSSLEPAGGVREVVEKSCRSFYSGHADARLVDESVRVLRPNFKFNDRREQQQCRKHMGIVPNAKI